jgi:hypothetical protein
MSSASASTGSLPYVIVGRGFSATVNREMLIQIPNSPLYGKQLIHIGGTDPWRTYTPVEMGQWPLLLTLPAYSMRPNGTQYRPMDSRHFARITSSQWIGYSTGIKFGYSSENVVSIADHSSYFRLALTDGSTIDASHVDICAGPGPAKPIPSALGATAILALPGRPKPLLYAEDYLQDTTAKVTGNRVCVVGGGATGAWCVEIAQSVGNEVVWLAEKKLNGAFVSSKRNDRLLVPPVVRKLDNGNHVVDGNVCPIHPTTTFGENVEVISLSLSGSAKIVVGHQASTSGASIFTTLAGTSTSLADNRFDQVVWATGQATLVSEFGSWAEMLKTILDVARNNGRHLIIDHDQKVVGLQSDNGRLRVLGASALAHADVKKEWETAGTPSNLYFRSLVEQARVSLGITLAAVTIAGANDYWAPDCNPSLNTASLSDMKQLMLGWPPEFDSAEAWFESRGARIHPYEPVEIARLLTQQFTY